MPLAKLRQLYPVISLLLVFLGPYFFYHMLQFLQRLDYVAAFFALLAGWFLLRTGVDLCRAVLATDSPPPRSSQSSS